MRGSSMPISGLRSSGLKCSSRYLGGVPSALAAALACGSSQKD